MPVPWGDASRVRTRIPDTSHRAMTVGQLRALRVFIQRLCKTRLLKRSCASPPVSPKQSGNLGNVIDWFEIDLYSVTDEIIKVAIPHVDPLFATSDGEKERASKQGWCSWAEFVAPGPQAAKILLSHWWGGRFRDLMNIVDMLVEEKSLGINTCIWICTFANCQWGEDFGEKIVDCPFVRAIAVADLIVLIVDRCAGSLKRTWCGLEMHCAIDQEKELEVYTPSGRVGGTRATSGPLVEAVKDWDIRESEASDDSYRRQMFNYIAGVHELTGLQTDSNGKAVLDSGRPVLIDREVDNEVVHPNRKCELKHEVSLFKKHSKKFESLNKMVSLEVMARIGRKRKYKTCVVPILEHRGITLGQWRAFVRKVETTFMQWRPPGSLDQSAPTSWEDLSCRVVIEYFVFPSRRDTLSYMETISDGPQVPRFYINFAWDSRFIDVVACVDWFAEAKQLPDSVVIFVDALARNQEVPMCNRACTSDFIVKGLGDFGRPLAECEGMLVCLDTERDRMMRLWRLLELDVAVRSGVDIYLGCAFGAMTCHLPFADGGFVFGVMDPNVGRLLRSINVRDSKASIEDYQKKIFAHFEEKGGLEYMKSIHDRLSRWGAGPALRDAAASDDAEEIVYVCATRGLGLNSDSLKGGLGQTALHVAAATGSTAALSALLRMGADPNCEDCMRERPLHYACLVGQEEAVSLLLQASADPRCESIFGEEPLSVALQNPAGLLGTKLEKVVAILKEATARGKGMDAARTLQADMDHLAAAALAALAAYETF